MGTRKPAGGLSLRTGEAKRLRRPSWKLQDAKAKFSEVVRRARSEGPQRVTVRGKDAVVVIAAEELARLVAPPPATPLVPFLESLHVEGLDLTREFDTGRDFTS
ncbi:MAG: type II toxin-antitoxin system Phd/YefM family antitoxin [Methylocystis sp.]|nr:type II toxin-antitoxin system Phd/YefM family antitoxin [Methylocystis sp.]